jgi:hypothetical protein
MQNCLKLAKMYLVSNSYDSLDRILQEVKDTCKTASGSYDMSKAKDLLDAFSIEIKMC